MCSRPGVAHRLTARSKDKVGLGVKGMREDESKGTLRALHQFESRAQQIPKEEGVARVLDEQR